MIINELSTVRKSNRYEVLKYIFSHQITSRIDISRSLNISKMTISSIVQDLLDEKILIEVFSESTSIKAGRPIRSITLNDQYFTILGIDIGVNHINLIAYSLTGDIFYTQNIKPTDIVNSIYVIDTIITMVQECMELALKDKIVIGLGVGLGGIVDSSGMVINSPDLQWFNVNLKELLDQRFDFQIEVDNCTRLMLNSEIHKNPLFTTAPDKNILFVNIGYGIGSAIFLNKEIYSGISELGHTYAGGNIKCFCGSQGCLETLASGNALEQLGSDLVGYQISGSSLDNLAREGDVEAQKIYTHLGEHLGISIANVINIIGIDTVILGGGISNSYDLFHSSLYKKCHQNVINVLKPSLQIELSVVKNDSVLYGCFLKILFDFFQK